MNPIKPDSSQPLPLTRSSALPSKENKTHGKGPEILSQSEAKPKSVKVITLSKAIPDGIDPIWIEAVNNRWDQVVSMLSRRDTFDINIAPNEGINAGKTLLWLAAKNGRWDLVQDFMNREGVDLDKCPTSGPDGGKTVLWMLTHKEYLDKNLDEIQEKILDELLSNPKTDKNAAPIEGFDKERTVAWMYHYFHQDRIYPVSLDEILLGIANAEENQGLVREYRTLLLLDSPLDLTVCPAAKEGSSSKLDGLPLLSLLIGDKNVTEEALKALIENNKGDYSRIYKHKRAPGSRKEEWVSSAISFLFHANLWDRVKACIDQGFDFSKLDLDLRYSLAKKALEANEIDIFKAIARSKDFLANMTDDIPMKMLTNEDRLSLALEVDLMKPRNQNRYYSDTTYTRIFPDMQNFVYRLNKAGEVFNTDYTLDNPFTSVPDEIKLKIVKEALREHYPYIDNVPDSLLHRFITQNIDLSKNKAKAKAAIIQRAFGVWRTEIEGLGIDKNKKVQFEDFERMWNQAIKMVEKEYGGELVLDKEVRDNILEAFTKVTPPLRRSKIIEIIKEASGLKS